MSSSKKGGGQQIVIKRVKKGGHGGHHGGAWKIAYADFVTAMMAFFLLMWLLGSTSKGDLRGISDYFNSPLRVSMAGGSGAGESTLVIPGGGADLSRSAGQVPNGEKHPPTEREALKAALETQEKEQLVTLGRRLEDAISTSPRLAELSGQIQLEMTIDGLRIQIVDAQNRPMFDTGSATVKDYMRELLRHIGKVLNDVPHRVTLAGHTDPTNYSSGNRGYSNWELSADRANASRRELVAGGLEESKLMRVVGLAAALPLDPRNPKAAINRRISITVMNRATEQRVLSGDRLELDRDASPEDNRSAIEKAVANGN